MNEWSFKTILSIRLHGFDRDKLKFLRVITGTAVAQWLRCCATNRKVAGSIPDGVIGIFHGHNPSGRTVALGVYSASNRNEYQEYFLGVKAAGA